MNMHFLRKGHEEAKNEVIEIIKIWESLPEEDKIKIINNLLKKYFIPLQSKAWLAYF